MSPPLGGLGQGMNDQATQHTQGLLISKEASHIHTTQEPVMQPLHHSAGSRMWGDFLLEELIPPWGNRDAELPPKLSLSQNKY